VADNIRTEPAGKADRRLELVAWAAGGLLLIAIFFALYVGYDFFMPFAGGIVLALVLSPIVGFLARHRVPRTVGAFLVLALIVTGLTGAFVQLAAPTADWIQNAPRILSQIERKLLPVKRSVENVKEAAEDIEKAAQVGGQSNSRTAPVPVTISPPSMLARIFGGFQSTVLHLGICVIFAYFLLSYADLFQEKIIESMPRVQQKRQVLAVTKQIESDVSGYLFAITLINITLGLGVGIGMHLIGLPNAALWGVMAAVLNFIPYFGLAVGLLVVFIVGLQNFETFTEALAGPGIYLLLNGLENQFITPSLLGRRLLINPAIIFVCVIFWGWFWGIAGALLAVPFLIVLKGIANHFAPLHAFGELLSGRSNGPNGNGNGKEHDRVLAVPAKPR
jgi:predicted PurR-regulated permease PerM